jgi:endonuclease/exonuclease/phosphatase family metal-dependent hydrolase
VIGGEFYPFARAAFPDSFLNKGALKVTVRLPEGATVNIWNVHLQDGGGPEVRLSQIRQLVARVQAAEDGQIADLVGGDFNCTPESSLYGELVRSLGPSVQQLGGSEPFVTWDGLSAKPGSGQTLDYIFVRRRRELQQVEAVPRAVFAAANLEQRLSDHLGVEAVITLGPGQDVIGTSGSRLPVVSVREAEYAGESEIADLISQ